MMSARKRDPVPPPVQRVLDKLGADIKSARLRRRVRAVTLAEHARISRTTLHKIERGDSGVSMGKYVSVLYVLEMHARVADLADRSLDRYGLDMLEERLPQRVRLSHRARGR